MTCSVRMTRRSILGVLVYSSAVWYYSAATSTNSSGTEKQKRPRVKRILKLKQCMVIFQRTLSENESGTVPENMVFRALSAQGSYTAPQTELIAIDRSNYYKCFPQLIVTPLLILSYCCTYALQHICRDHQSYILLFYHSQTLPGVEGR